ncbi:hypothetical protein BN1708_016166, partial [Verticillium longisporum]
QTYVGGTVFWMTRFDLPQLVAHCKRYSATTLLSPPPLLERRGMGAEVQNAAQRKLGGGQLGQVWGMSEASGPMTALPLNERDKSGSVAMLVAKSEMRIVDEEGRAVTPGVAGEAWVRGPQVVTGYFKNDRTTKRRASRLWMGGTVLATCCTSKMADFTLSIVPRGKSVVPAQLESVLTTHPQIRDAGVIGVKVDDDQVPRAYVVTTGPQISEEDISSWLNDQGLADEQQLRGGVVFIKEVPRSPPGKILRQDLRAMYVDA